MKNELSRAMASADVKVRYDTQCKRVLSQKEILARILARTVIIKYSVSFFNI